MHCQAKLLALFSISTAVAAFLGPAPVAAPSCPSARACRSTLNHARRLDMVLQEREKAAETAKGEAPIPGTPLVAKPAVDNREVFFKGEVDLNDALAFLDRSLDTLEDAAQHASRLWRPIDAAERSRQPSKNKGGKPRIIVIGTGWGGHALSKVIDVEKYDVVYVSRLSYFLFTPMLCAASVGTVDVRSITESIKLANPHVQFVQGTVNKSSHPLLPCHPKKICVQVLPEARKVVVECPSSRAGGETVTVELDYDTLVYAGGAKVGTFGIKGVEEHCYILKEVSDAQRLRAAIISRFDEATLPGLTEEEKRALLAFVVIGSGPTGKPFLLRSFAGELADLLSSDIPRLYPELDALVTLRVISAADTILPMFDRVLQEKGLERLKEEGIDVLLSKKVTEVRRDAVVLDGGALLPFGLCFWAGGTAPRQLTLEMIQEIPGQSEAEGAKRGQLTVDGFLRVQGTNGTILAVGDAAKVEGGHHPQTGQVAAQQGAYVARILNRGYNLTAAVPEAPSIAAEDLVEMAADAIRLRGCLKAKEFHFLNLGVLAYLGSGSALASLQGGDRTKLLDAAGRAGFLLWRSTYWVKQVMLSVRPSTALVGFVVVTERFSGFFP
ncbi:unnamed protein product [Phaeothamnion confervicola]